MVGDGLFITGMVGKKNGGGVMKTLSTIFFFEWLQLRRNKLMQWLLLLLTACCLYAIYYGYENIGRQQENMDLLEHANDSTKQVFQNYFKDKLLADSMRFGWVGMNSLYDGFTTEEYLENNIAVNKPNRSSHLSIGQRDIYPVYRRVTARSLYYDGTGIALDDKYAETANPHKLLAGNFDLSFVFLYLFPLFIIALCYNVLSGEKEQGTFAILSNQPVSLRRIVLIKLLFRVLVVSVLVLIYSGIGFLFSPVKEPFSITVFGAWAGLLLCYVLLWFALAFFIVSLKQNSSVNALVLVGCWMLFLVIVPSLINNHIAATYKISSRTKFVTEVGKEVGILWDVNDSLTLPAFYQAYPQYTTHPFKVLWSAAEKLDNLGKNEELDIRYNKRIYLWHFTLDKNITAQLNIYNKEQRDKLYAAEKFAWVNPVVTTQEALNDASFSGYRHQQRFRRATAAYRDSIFNISNRFVFGEKKLTLEDYKAYPDFDINKYAPQSGGDTTAIVVLLIFSFIFTTIGNLIFNRSQA